MENYFRELHNWFYDKKNEEISKCYVCDSKDYASFTKTSFGVLRCKKCGFAWQYYQPTQEVLDEFYKDSEPMKIWSNIKTSSDEEFRQIKKYTGIYSYMIKNDCKSVLDFGCGNGYFLNHIINENIIKIGIEVNLDASSLCQFPVFTPENFWGSQESKIKYDLITMLGVVEHLKDPIATIKEYISLLNDNGALIVIVPNVDSLIIKKLGTQTSTFCPQHLWYFNIKTLRLLMAKLDLVNYGFYTIESELQQILRSIYGFDPYENIKINLSHPDINDNIIFNNHLGYKIVAIFKKGDKNCKLELLEQV